MSIKNYKEKLSEYMRNSIRFCVTPIVTDGQAPSTALNAAEFFGAEGDMGFLDHVLSIVQDERKRCYEFGFLAGAKGTLEDLKSAPEGELTIDLEMNKILAERSFHEWRD